MQGWIKLHRELIEKAIWLESTVEQKTILITLLIMANHKEKEWEFKGKRYKAKQGQVVTSLASIAKKCGKGVSVQNIRTALKRFEKYDFLTDESTNANRLITINNWGTYQETEASPTGEPTSNQQATNKQLTTNKNDKNDKNDKNVKKKERRKPVYDETSVYYQLATFFFEQIKLNNPEHREPNIQRWADDIRKIIELDKRTEEQVKYLMQWVQKDVFEMVNVLSPAKLRQRWDQLVMKVKQQSKTINNVTPIDKAKQKYKYGF